MRTIGGILAISVGFVLAFFIRGGFEKQTESKSPKRSGRAQEVLQIKNNEAIPLEPRNLSETELSSLATALLNQRNPDSFSRDILRAVLREFAQNFPAQFVKWAATISPNEVVFDAVKVALSNLSFTRPELALNSAIGLRNPALTLGTLTNLMKRLGEVDPQLAATLLKTAPEAYFIRGAMTLSEQWAAVDPESALGFVAEIDTPQIRSSLLRSTLWLWAAKDFESAQKWAHEKDFSAQFAASLAEFGPIELAARALEESPVRNKEIYLRSLAKRWGEIDPVSALKWATEEPNARDKAILTRALVSSVIKRDPATAASIVDYLPSRDLRHGFFRQYAEEMARSNPQEALDWASRLSDPVSRSSATREVLRAWGTTDFIGAVNEAFGISQTVGERESFLRAIIERQDLSLLDQQLLGLPPERRKALSDLIFPEGRVESVTP